MCVFGKKKKNTKNKQAGGFNQYSGRAAFSRRRKPLICISPRSSCTSNPACLGYYHAASTALHPLDRVQERLCRELGISHEAVLLRYKLAPLKSIRDMALFGLLHRVVLNEVSPQLAERFPPVKAWLKEARSSPPASRAFLPGAAAAAGLAAAGATLPEPGKKP